jgi:hypothetical protein
MGRTEKYVVDLLEQTLGPAERGKRFDWAVGNVSSKTKRAVRLPFDAVWENRKLIVDVDEEQHTQETPFFDKKDRLTVSGVHRGEQRKQYDEKKRGEALIRGYKLVAISWPRTRKPKLEDSAELRAMLQREGVVP